MNNLRKIFALSILLVFTLSLISTQIVKADGWTCYKQIMLPGDADADDVSDEDAGNYWRKELLIDGHEAGMVQGAPGNPWPDSWTSLWIDVNMVGECFVANAGTSDSLYSEIGTYRPYAGIYFHWVWEGPGTSPGGYAYMNYTINTGGNYTVNGTCSGSTPPYVSMSTYASIYDHTDYHYGTYIPQTDAYFIVGQYPDFSYTGPTPYYGSESGISTYGGQYNWGWAISIYDVIELNEGNEEIQLFVKNEMLSAGAEFEITDVGYIHGLAEVWSELWGELDFVSK